MKCPKAVKATNETAWVPECLCAVSLLKLTAEDNPLPALLLLLLRDAESCTKDSEVVGGEKCFVISASQWPSSSAA